VGVALRRGAKTVNMAEFMLVFEEDCNARAPQSQQQQHALGGLSVGAEAPAQGQPGNL
jgi:hypothetical protein